MAESEGRYAQDIFRTIFGEDERLLDEDSFVSKMLRVQVDLLPNDLRKLFHFIDNTDEHAITVDKAIAVLNLDSISGLPAALQGKLRERARELGSAGKPPVVFFREADQWGGKDMVTRMEFKDVLKKMGFSLVDEPDLMNVVGNERMTDQNHNPQQQQKEGNGNGNGEDELLNDSFGGDDDRLIEKGEVFPARQGMALAGAAGGGGGGLQALKQSRDEFQARREQLLRQNEEAIAFTSQLQAPADGAGAGSVGPAATSKKRGSSSQPVLGMNLFDQSPNLNPQQSSLDSQNLTFSVDHRVSLSAKDSRPLMSSISAPANNEDELSVPRGGGGDLRIRQEGQGIAELDSLRAYSTRAASDMLQSQSQAQGQGQTASSSSILVVESLMSKRAKATPQFAQLCDELLKNFIKVDSRRLGYITRTQFAHVLQQSGQ